jgi:hypothetical protein
LNHWKAKEMVLEHSKDPVSARWNKETNSWDIGEKVKYRWNSSDNSPESDWFYDITDALTWIVRHDSGQ